MTEISSELRAVLRRVKLGPLMATSLMLNDSIRSSTAIRIRRESPPR